MTPHARPRKAAKSANRRKRYGGAAAPRRVVFVDVNDPKWADLREQLAEGAVATDEQSEAFRRWLKSAK